MGEEGEAGDKNLKLVADSMLLAAAGWGLQSSKQHPFAAVGFGLYAAKGLMGMLGYAIDDSNLNNAKTEVNKLAKNFGIPCFVSEMTLSSGCVPTEFSPEIFLVPVMDWAWRFAQKDFSKVFLSISQGHALGVASSCVLKDRGLQDTVAYDLFLSSLIAEEMEFSPEFQTALLSIANILMWAVMENKLKFT